MDVCGISVLIISFAQQQQLLVPTTQLAALFLSEAPCLVEPRTHTDTHALFFLFLYFSTLRYSQMSWKVDNNSSFQHALHMSTGAKAIHDTTNRVFKRR